MQSYNTSAKYSKLTNRANALKEIQFPNGCEKYRLSRSDNERTSINLNNVPWVPFVLKPQTVAYSQPIFYRWTEDTPDRFTALVICSKYQGITIKSAKEK